METTVETKVNKHSAWIITEQFIPKARLLEMLDRLKKNLQVMPFSHLEVQTQFLGQGGK